MKLKVHYELSRKMLAVKVACFEDLKNDDEIDVTKDQEKVTCITCLRKLGKLPRRKNKNKPRQKTVRFTCPPRARL